MNQSFNKSIRDTITLAEKHGLLFQAGASSSLQVPREVKFKTRKASSYKEVYDVIVEYQSFNLMLKDRSIFQFTETEKQRDVRLVFYPNPYQFSEYLSERRDALEMLNSQEITELEYEQLISEGEFSSDIPVIRYDLSIDQHCKLYHPAAHFHIGFHAENRWPVNRALTPKAFFLKTLYNYYTKEWKEQEQVDGEFIFNHYDQLYRAELQDNCPTISDLSPINFDQIEGERLHFR